MSTSTSTMGFKMSNTSTRKLILKYKYIYLHLDPRLVHKGDYGSRWDGGKKHDRSGVDKERYVASCAGYEGSKRNRTKSLRTPCCTE